MNPVTAQLIQQIDDRKIIRFVHHWDELEALVIRVYKGARSTPEDEKQYRRLRRVLGRALPRYEDELALYWPQATVGGRPARDDPFRKLTSYEVALHFVGNWPAMQRLPAARQALNEWLLDQINEA